MKITRSRLKEIIKEEINKILDEADVLQFPTRKARSRPSSASSSKSGEVVPLNIAKPETTPERIPASSMLPEPDLDIYDDHLRYKPKNKTAAILGYHLPEKILAVAKIPKGETTGKDIKGNQWKNLKKEINDLLNKLPKKHKNTSVYNEISTALKKDKLDKYDVYDFSTAFSEMSAEIYG